ncbi:prevent-host-death family protein [Clostridium tepidiprofundi]|nr:prevent-host-death family protein [Clostridium tepidiprofundi]
MVKPIITKDQMVKSSEAAKRFGSIRKKAKKEPLYITDNGNIDSVLIGYDYFEKMYIRLMELEEKEEVKILSSRIEYLENNPSSAVPWRNIRSTGK